MRLGAGSYLGWRREHIAEWLGGVRCITATTRAGAGCLATWLREWEQAWGPVGIRERWGGGGKAAYLQGFGREQADNLKERGKDSAAQLTEIQEITGCLPTWVVTEAGLESAGLGEGSGWRFTGRGSRWGGGAKK